MKIVYAFGLATAMAISPSLHAQSCSGGAQGGMDATGNQCNASGSVEAYTTGSSAVPSLASSGTNLSARVSPLAVRLPRTALPKFRSPVIATPVGLSRPAAIAPLPTVKNDDVHKSMCSGGVDGGMDATGNQCSE